MTTIELNKKTILIAAGAVVAVVVSAFAIPALFVKEQAPFTLFTEARSACGSEGITVSDGNSTLTIDMMGEDEWSGASFTDVECAIDRATTPSFIKDNIWATNSLAGRQSDTFDVTLGGEGTDYAETVYEVEISWAYHPDNGLDAVLHATEKSEE